MQSHGDFQIWCKNNVVYANASDSWNEETAKEFNRIFQHTVKTNGAEKWAHIVFLNDWDLGVPEIEPIIIELTQWCIANGMTHAAQVFSRSMIKKYQLDKMVSEKIGDFERRQFGDEEEAYLWLREQGYDIIPIKSQKHSA